MIKDWITISSQYEISTYYVLVGCVLQPVPKEIAKYRVYLFSLGTSLDFYCAQGTIFYKEKCACDWTNDPNSNTLLVP